MGTPFVCGVCLLCWGYDCPSILKGMAQCVCAEAERTELFLRGCALSLEHQGVVINPPLLSLCTRPRPLELPPSLERSQLP